MANSTLAITTLNKSRERGAIIGHMCQVIHDLRVIGRSIPTWSWLLPLLGITLLALLASGQMLSLFVGKYAWTGKDFQEVLGPSLLGGAVIVSVYLWSVERGFCRAWLICLPALLLCREIHFAGTGTGVYIGLAAIWVSALHQRQRLQPVWNCPALCGWWFGAITWYVLAVSVDSGVFKWLPHSHWWSVNLEETLESGGHLAILMGALGSTLMKTPKDYRPNILRVAL